MNANQAEKEIMYQNTIEILDQMIELGMISEEEYQKINRLNLERLAPDLIQVYT